MKLNAWSIVLVTVSLTSCAESGRGPAPNSFCDVAKPIYFDPADRMTKATEKAIITHNEKWEAVCRH